MTYRILVGLLLSTSLVACGPPRPTATPEDLATAAAQAAWRDRVKRYDAQWAKAVSDCYGDQRATEYVARGVARDLQKACEIDATIKLGPSPALSSISVEPPAAAPTSAKAAEPVTAAIQAVARPTVADVSMINRPGEVSDAYICDSADAVGYDPQPGCEHVDAATLWVESTDPQGRATIKLNGDRKYALAVRTLINCNGTASTLRTFWDELQGRYDFRPCDAPEAR